jgi:hypothetical protein
MMECKGNCGRYKANRPRSGGWRYTTGQKRCQVCDIYLNWEGLRCPCCGNQLRSGPKKTKQENKEKNKN